MKRQILKIFIATVCAITLVLLLPVGVTSSRTNYAIASDNGGVKKGLTLYEQGKYSEARKQFKKFPETASESSLKKMSSKMKKAYLSKVQKYKTFSEAINDGGEYIWAYYLTDINKDGNVELLIQHGSCEADCLITIYKYSKGKATKLKSMNGALSISYAYPDGYGFIKLFGHMGYETISRITLKDDKIIEKEIGSRSVETVDDYMYVPYQLDGHISSNNVDIDYSALK
jgi:hypothetical protein